MLTALLASLSLAAAPATPTVKVEALSLQIVDRTTGKVVAMDKLPNDYGMDMDVLVSVKVSGKVEHAAAPTLTLVVSAAAQSSEATGDVPGWKVEQKRTVEGSDAAAAWYAFVVPYRCAPKVRFTAKVGTSEKTLVKDLGCAE